MPLRDHFHPPLGDLRSWDSIHGQWPAMIVIDLNQRLPEKYSASPHIHLGTDSQDEYEVRVIESQHRRLVAAIEIVSPANKDRPEHRRAFAAKCAGLIHQGVSVSIVDLVTNRRANLYDELLNQLGEDKAVVGQDPPTLYAVTCRSRRGSEGLYKIESWVEPVAVNRLLPTLPLWLSADLAVPLDLEKTYEETCRILRIL